MEVSITTLTQNDNLRSKFVLKLFFTVCIRKSRFWNEQYIVFIFSISELQKKLFKLEHKNNGIRNNKNFFRINNILKYVLN